MSEPTHPTTNPPPRGAVSLTTLFLGVLLGTTTTAAVFFGVHYFRSPVREGDAAAPGRADASARDPGGKEGAKPAPADPPFAQQGSVKPDAKSSGMVYYPLPYATPPHLTLTAPKRRYEVTRQDEFGFEWAAKPLPEDFVTEGKEKRLRAEVVHEDFDWIAKGLRPGGRGLPVKIFEQRGTFYAAAGSKGQVSFTFPYQAAPNLEVRWTVAAGRPTPVVVPEVTETGFKWQNSSTWSDDRGEVTWVAKGVKSVTFPLPK